MAEEINDLTIEYEEDGKILTRELDKCILSKGSWATLIFRYQTWTEKDNAYSEDKYVIQRYRKTGGVYKRQSKFNISNKTQAQKIIDALTGWIEE